MRRLIRGAARAAVRARGFFPTTIGGERFRTDPDHIGFWHDVSHERWEADTFRFLQSSLRPNDAFADIGAWIGPTSIYAARRCRRVYGFEPDPRAFRYLLWNVELNRLDNVVPMNVALGPVSGFRPMWGGGGPLGTSTSSLLVPEGVGPALDVWVVAWTEWLSMARPGRIDCIKIDIEGGEFELLPAMRDYLAAERPALHLSLHAGLLPEALRETRLAAILDVLAIYPAWFRPGGAPVSRDDLAAEARAGDCSFCTGVAA